ncbi:MAG: hypothetical protein HN348_27735 [Proteobacteria bacterium]|jgi:hypothetical protein|nr:hypothetical protein [Pseudomonadota bacterium]
MNSTVINLTIALCFLLLIPGCTGKAQSATWLEGLAFSWTSFNHRLSHLEVRLDQDEAELGLVGGTSTSGIVTVLPSGCDPGTCTEYPFYDDATMWVKWGKATTKAQFAHASLEVIATPDGGSASTTAVFDRRIKGDVTAILQGLRLSTDYALAGGDACYTPANGWLPTAMSLVIDEPVKTGKDEVLVEVTAKFEAGPTLEENRACLDEVLDEVQVAIQVDVLLVATKKSHESHTVSHYLAYEWNGDQIDPTPQPEPDQQEQSFDIAIEDALVGWSEIDFRFQQEGEERGAYIRSLSVMADSAGWASGHGSNYSPGTQLSAFDYEFSGVVRAVDVAAEVEGGTTDTLIDVLVDEEGIPQTTTMTLE